MDSVRFIIGVGIAGYLAEWHVGAIMAKEALSCVKNLPTNVKCTRAVILEENRFDFIFVLCILRFLVLKKARNF